MWRRRGGVLVVLLSLGADGSFVPGQPLVPFHPASSSRTGINMRGEEKDGLESEDERKRILQTRHVLRLREICEARRAAAAARRPLPFEVAREAVQWQGLRTRREWRSWIRGNAKALRYRFMGFYPDGPAYVPEAPDDVYADEWRGWDDWLGVILPYEEAKRVAASLGVSSQEQWWQFAEGNDKLLMRLRIPATPHLYYRNGEWQGYDDWLGLGCKPLYFSRADGGA